MEGEGAKAEGGSDKRLFVGNIAWEVTSQDLKELMMTTGFEVVKADVMTTYGGRSKGYGIVEFATAEGATKAKDTLNDSDLKGRPIFIREDRGVSTKPPGGDRGGGSRGGGGRYGRGGRGGRGGGGGGGGGDPNITSGVQLFVGNLSFETTEQELRDHFGQCGTIEKANIVTNANGRSRGFGIVRFAEESQAADAISRLNEQELKGRPLQVRYDSRAPR